MPVFSVRVLAFAALALSAVPVHAHVTLAERQAPIDSRYEARLRVPHGCNGSPTIQLRVRIPDGVVDVQPHAKAGWAVEVITAAYDPPLTHEGRTLTEGVREVIWSGGSLTDKAKAEFAFSAYLTADLLAGSLLYFPVVQGCQQGVARWIDRPAPGQKPAADHSDSPAPALKLLPARP